jgi:hypothetical protein
LDLFWVGDKSPYNLPIHLRQHSKLSAFREKSVSQP